MPFKNSIVHLTRIQKVEIGFKAAGLEEKDTTSVLASFNAKTKEEAQAIASLTEFKVGNFEGWGQNANLKRQMARAFIFLENLSELQSPEDCQSVFNQIWHKKSLDELKKDVRDAVNKFKASGNNLAHGTSKANLDIPKVPGRITASPAVRDFFSKVSLGNRSRSFDNHKREKTTDINIQLLNLGIRLNQSFTTAARDFLAMRMRYLMAQNYAIESFVKEFNSGQEILNFKVNVINKAVGALGELAPPPLNIAAKGLELILSKVKAQTKVLRHDIEFDTAHTHATYETDSLLGKISQSVAAANDKLDRLLSVGLDADNAPTSKAKLEQAAITFFDNFDKLLTNTFENEVSHFFGSKDGNAKPGAFSAGIYDKLFTEKGFTAADVYSLQTGLTLTRGENNSIINKRIEIDAALNSYCSEIENHVNACVKEFDVETNTMSQEDLAVWILISLIADHACSLSDGIIADPTLKEDTIRNRLFGGGRTGSVVKDLGALEFTSAYLAPFKHFGMLEEIKDNGFSRVAGTEKIPWSTGQQHVKCKTIMFLYLVWVRKNFKPMSMCISQIYEKKFINASKDEIKRLGRLINDHGHSPLTIVNNIKISSQKEDL
jgi:hypothetical protein